MGPAVVPQPHSSSSSFSSGGPQKVVSCCDCEIQASSCCCCRPDCPPWILGWGDDPVALRAIPAGDDSSSSGCSTSSSTTDLSLQLPASSSRYYLLPIPPSSGLPLICRGDDEDRPDSSSSGCSTSSSATEPAQPDTPPTHRQMTEPDCSGCSARRQQHCGHAFQAPLPPPPPRPRPRSPPLVLCLLLLHLQLHTASAWMQVGRWIQAVGPGRHADPGIRGHVDLKAMLLLLPPFCHQGMLFRE